MLELRNVTKKFGGLVAVNDLSFKVTQGSMVGLLGPNGSGKSTVMNLVSGALSHTAGHMFFEGQRIDGRPCHQVARAGIARTFQLVRLAPSLSVHENVMLPMAFAGKSFSMAASRDAADDILERVGLKGQGGRSVNDLNYIDQKRVELARAISTNPRLLLLDEWMAGLNPSELGIAIDLIGSLNGLGTTILLVEHIMQAVRALCPICIVMTAGTKIADGPTADVLADKQVVDAYLGSAAHA